MLLEIDTKAGGHIQNSMDAAKVAWDDAQSTLARMDPLHVPQILYLIKSLGISDRC